MILYTFYPFYNINLWSNKNKSYLLHNENSNNEIVIHHSRKIISYKNKITITNYDGSISTYEIHMFPNKLTILFSGIGIATVGYLYWLLK